jgi:hypothetical protein
MGKDYSNDAFPVEILAAPPEPAAASGNSGADYGVKTMKRSASASPVSRLDPGVRPGRIRIGISNAIGTIRCAMEAVRFFKTMIIKDGGSLAPGP